jgi:hypothetical protein
MITTLFISGYINPEESEKEMGVASNNWQMVTLFDNLRITLKRGY